MKTLILLPFILTLCLATNAQWNIRTIGLKRDDLCDLTTTVKPGQFQQGYTFFGPTFSLDEKVITRGATPFHVHDESAADTIGNADDLVWDIPCPYKSMVWPADTYLYLNCYTQNISRYTIFFQDQSGAWYKKTFIISHDQYQVPEESALATWSPTKLSTTEIRESHRDSIFVSRFLVTLERKKTLEPCKFVIAECKLLHHSLHERPATGCFFYELTGDTINRQPSYSTTVFGNTYPISKFTIFRDIYAQSFVFDWVGQKDSARLQQKTLELLSLIADKYPYYQEHHIARLSVKRRLSEILAMVAPFTRKIRSIDSLFSTFSDGHFYFEKQAVPKTGGPIYLKDINGKVEVAGVFNDSLKTQIALGSTITAIDSMPVETYISQTASRYFGRPEDRRNQAIATMLYKRRQDSTSLDFEYNGKSGKLVYHYTDPVVIPGNFKPVHDEFRLLGHCAYIKLNRWDAGDWIRFYDNRDALKRCTNVIFDLRGNTGGTEVEAYRILSCFIDHPVLATHAQYRLSDNKLLDDSNVIEPNRYLDLHHLSIIILVDNRTACASEIFTSILKNDAGATVIGAERTSGSYASGEVFYLPFNLVLRTDILTKFAPPQGVPPIEFTGISPNIFVNIEGFSDLYPYNDKVLATALGFVNHKSIWPGNKTVRSGD